LFPHGYTYPSLRGSISFTYVSENCQGQNSKNQEELKMRKTEDLPNLGNSILSISGSNRGVHLILIGNKESLIEILRMALRESQPLREIVEALMGDEHDKE
jgi:hypothetical protein